ncbi:MAG: DNA replication and repair protein RecF [Muribaculaceae bacterium]|nr:DNA replication and repair protein RecF [Muribaculaceae bacterium]
MILKSISILNYKNIAEARLNFSEKVNCFTGKNGMGKTNLLDAIYYLSFCKSFSNQPDIMTIRYDSDFLMLQGSYTRKGEIEEVSLGIQRGKRKTLKRNGKEYKRLSKHIGLLPVVMVSPMDWDLIRGGSEERRRLIDLIISQSDSEYLAHLIRYNKCLDMRNSMLKQGISDSILYESVENAMSESADSIYILRNKWIQDFAPIFHSYYASISGNSENVKLQYQSQLSDSPMQSLLNSRRAKDAIVGYTTAGIHRDDIELELNDYSMRKVGSQGQCKTYTIALRLAQFDFLKSHSGITPILLLDDIFDKLDSSRVENIISVVSNPTFGQIFITDTDRTHLDEIIKRSGDYSYKIFTVENGECADNNNNTLEL